MPQHLLVCSARPEGRTIDHLIDAGVLRYQVSGSPGGEPVVFINSLGTDQRLWGPLHALTTHYRVVTYDARGQAGTSAPPAPYTIADLGTDVVMLLDRLELRHVHVVGISLGGLAALWLGIHRADRVRSLLLANTAARIGSAEGWQERIDAVHARGMTRLATDVMERFFSDGFRKRNPDTVATFAHRFASHDAEGYVGQCAALRDTDLGPDVGRCEVPTSVVALGVSTPRPRPSKHAGCTSTSQVPNYAPSTRDTCRTSRMLTGSTASSCSTSPPWDRRTSRLGTFGPEMLPLSPRSVDTGRHEVGRMELRWFEADPVTQPVRDGTVLCPINGRREDIETCLSCRRLVTVDGRDGTMSCRPSRLRLAWPLPPA